jgi:hypothetical protein
LALGIYNLYKHLLSENLFRYLFRTSADGRSIGWVQTSGYL